MKTLNKYGFTTPYFFLTLTVSVIPFVLYLFGFKLHFVNAFIDLGNITTLNELSSQENLNPLLAGKFIHTLIVGASITIAFLTAVLSFVDYFIKKNVSTPIVGIALFCSAMLDLVHILSADKLIHYDLDNTDITSFTWLFSRVFHALILILGVGIFLLQKKESVIQEYKSEKYFVAFISLIFFLLSVNATLIVTDHSLYIPSMVYPDAIVSHPFDLIPLLLYLIAGIFIFPEFYKQNKSTFSQTLTLSLIPSIAAQLHMALGSKEIYDYHFYAAQLLKTISYFVPFIGLTINYIETYMSEKEVTKELDIQFTSRQEIQSTLEGILNGSLNGIMAFDPIKNKSGDAIDFKCTLVNPAAERITEYDKKDLLGKTVSELFPKNKELIMQYRNVYQSANPVTFEQFNERLNKFFQISVVKVRDGIATTFNDNTAQKKGQEAILNSQRIQATNKFARVMTHEIRNPLTNITLAVEQLKLELDITEDQQIYLDILSRNSERINQLISEVMNASKMTDLQLSEINTIDLVNDTILLAEDRIKLQNIEVNIPDLHSINLQIDVPKMKIALLNIILNAIEAMKESGGLLKISGYKQNDEFIFEISDNGNGISEEHLSRLFEPFFTSKSKGFGIGLTATQTIIFNHDGKIDVKSKLNDGTTFIVFLPINSTVNEIENKL